MEAEEKNWLNAPFLERCEFVQTLLRVVLKQKKGEHAQVA